MARAANKDIVPDVKAAVDIVDLLGGYLDLKPAGTGRFKALCPFHQEKTPSFHVSRDRQTFHCFGCDKGGDIFSFIQDIEGIGFREALEQLADRAGIQVPTYSGGDKGGEDDRAELFKVHEFAARFYHESLMGESGIAGREYVKSRGFGVEMAKRFEIGYVREGWQHLTDAALAKGFHRSILELSGLAKQGERGLYDRFRNRLMFPIRDVSGRVVAFGGRALDDDPAKYMNSPENPVYKKNRVLYGLNEARESLRETKEAIIVEGYFDVIRCVDMGIENVVAACGTALTPAHATLLKRYVSNVLVVFDGDEAGVRAALRSVGILVAAGLSVRAMTLPDGLDPDDYLQAHGAEAFQKLASDAPDFVRFYVLMNPERRATIEGRTEIAKELFAVLSDITDVVRQEEYVKLLARELGLDVHKCRQAFGAHEREGAGRSAVEPEGDEIRVRVNSHDREFVSVLCRERALLDEVVAAVGLLELTPTPLLEVVEGLAHFEDAEMLQRLESDSARQLYTAAASGEETVGDRQEALVRERIQRFKDEALLQELRQVKERLYRAEQSHDEALTDEMAMREIEINRQLKGVSAA